MRKLVEEKLKMVKDHIELGKSLSHISEENDNFDTGQIKYLVNLYKKRGENNIRM